MNFEMVVMFLLGCLARDLYLEYFVRYMHSLEINGREIGTLSRDPKPNKKDTAQIVLVHKLHFQTDVLPDEATLRISYVLLNPITGKIVFQGFTRTYG